MVSKQVCLNSHIFNSIVTLNIAKAFLQNIKTLILLLGLYYGGLCNTGTAVAPLQQHTLFLLALGCKTQLV
jgi:hypothetical protein